MARFVRALSKDVASKEREYKVGRWVRVRDRPPRYLKANAERGVDGKHRALEEATLTGDGGVARREGRADRHWRRACLSV
jgi:hypothetical protein